MDGLGFSLCAMPLDIVGSCISKCYYYSSTCLIYSPLCQQLHQNTNIMKKLKLFEIFIYIISYYSFLTFKFYSDFS